MHACRDTGVPAVSVASQSVNGLGREHIEQHRVLPPVPYVALPVELGGLPADAPERERPQPNRAERRAAARRMQRRTRRG